MVQEFFIELTIVLLVATVLGIIFNKLKQPVLLAFIVTGIVLSASFFNVINSTDLLKIFSEIGIAFLLFLVGINLDLKVLKDIGRASLVTGIGQIVFTTVVGIAICFALGFNIIEALYIAIALTFSSTIIIVKLLSDKKEINSLYGKISIGFLLVQDFVAIIALIFISSLSATTGITGQITQFFLGITMLAIIFFVTNKFLAKKFFEHISNNQDLLFLGSIAWCFLFTSIAIFLGFSKEIGAFIAGVSLASLPHTHEILGKIRYLRDFFVIIFFVVLGASLVITSAPELILIAVLLSAFVLIGNPIIVFALMLFLGYKGRTSFLASLTVAQISEFSLILIFLGQKVGHVSNEIVSIITLVAVITISVSTYMIIFNNKIYDLFIKKIPLFKSKRFIEDSLHKTKEKNYDIVCVGYGDTGKRIFTGREFAKLKILIIDFNPAELNEARKKGFDCFYGDLTDLETIEKIVETKPKVVVSTAMDVIANATLSKMLYKRDKNLQLIVMAHDTKDAEKLSKEKIEFVLVPTTIAASKIRTILCDIDTKKQFELSWLKFLEKN